MEWQLVREIDQSLARLVQNKKSLSPFAQFHFFSVIRHISFIQQVLIRKILDLRCKEPDQRDEKEHAIFNDSI
jgi:hypothetical protein